MKINNLEIIDTCYICGCNIYEVNLTYARLVNSNYIDTSSLCSEKCIDEWVKRESSKYTESYDYTEADYE